MAALDYIFQGIYSHLNYLFGNFFFINLYGNNIIHDSSTSSRLLFEQFDNMTKTKQQNIGVLKTHESSVVIH